LRMKFLVAWRTDADTFYYRYSNLDRTAAGLRDAGAVRPFMDMGDEQVFAFLLGIFVGMSIAVGALSLLHAARDADERTRRINKRRSNV